MSRDAAATLPGRPADTPYFRHHALVYWAGTAEGLPVERAGPMGEFAAGDDAGLTHPRVMTD